LNFQKLTDWSNPALGTFSKPKLREQYSFIIDMNFAKRRFWPIGQIQDGKTFGISSPNRRNTSSLPKQICTDDGYWVSPIFLARLKTDPLGRSEKDFPNLVKHADPASRVFP